MISSFNHKNQTLPLPEMSKYDKELFERYGINKLNVDQQNEILFYMYANGYRYGTDSKDFCEKYIYSDTSSIISNKNSGFGLYSCIGKRIKVIKYLETGEYKPLRF